MTKRKVAIGAAVLICCAVLIIVMVAAFGGSGRDASDSLSVGQSADSQGGGPRHSSGDSRGSSTTQRRDGRNPEGRDRDGRDRSFTRDGEATLKGRSVQQGLIQREYLVLKPSWSSPSDPLPLVVVLHGLGVDRSGMVSSADWRGAVQQRGFIAVFPQGFANSWNVGPCCLPASLLEMDDIGFLDMVISAVVATEPVAPDRTYVTGFSAGGIMTYAYGCARADRLAAIAPMAGPNLTGCSPDAPLSLLHQHSDPDLVVPFGGGPGVGQIVSNAPLPPILDTVKAWASDIGCRSESTWTPVVPTVEEMTWSGCRDGATTRLVRLQGRGHEWPRAKGYDGLAAILDFFGIR